MKIGIAADHGGFELKNTIKIFLEKKGYELKDYGAHQLVTTDDYPDFILPLARGVAIGEVFWGIAI